jgi:ubiquinone/menaquinone biosynthesis C-methylase UbiE
MAGLIESLNARLDRSLFEPIAAEVARAVAPGARVLDAGCGRGQLSALLAGTHGLDVTGVDVDPDEIAIARAGARTASLVARDARQPTFVVADIANLPFEDAAFDLVTSTFSMHHWDDPVGGLTEIRRVLRPGARAIIWDLRRGFSLFHLRTPDPLEPVRLSPLELVSDTPWRWPWGFSISRRIELRRATAEGDVATPT